MLHQILENFWFLIGWLAVLALIFSGGRGCYLDNQKEEQYTHEWNMACISHCPAGTTVDASSYQGTCNCKTVVTTTTVTEGQ